tara:strand:+ start:1831 stop:2223 length:393 start_codon:yes stop_codon:yes gene_type:complete
MKIRYGGELKPGDFIAVSETGCYINLGWYFGKGKSGTLQYLFMATPGEYFENFTKWKNGESVNLWEVKRFEKYGFTSKLFYKAYIYGSGIDKDGTRVMKIENPENILSGEDLEKYNKSREALIYIKMLEK